jgi:hypothetical protein
MKLVDQLMCHKVTAIVFCSNDFFLIVPIINTPHVCNVFVTKNSEL